MITICSILVLLMCSLCFGASQYADCNKLSVISGCLCPGRSIVYECAVADSTSQGLTVWEVPRIMNSLCSTEISLSHTAMNFGDQTGGCVEALGKGVSVSGGCFLSQLAINVSSIFAEGGGIERNVTCSFDNGTVIIVESKRLSVPTAGDLSITNLSLTNSRPGWLKFSWDLVKVLDCPSIDYMINATDGCGLCPSNVSINAATCREVRGGSNCTVSIYADICHDRIWSESLTLITASIDVSITSLRLSESQVGELTFSWDQVTVNISDCPSIFYMINTTNGCGVCPQNVSTNFATCREVKGGKSCTFTVYAHICYDRTSTATITVDTNLVSPSTGDVRIIAGIVTSVGLAIIITLLIIVTGIIVFGVRLYKRQQLKQIENGYLELEHKPNHKQQQQKNVEQQRTYEQLSTQVLENERASPEREQLQTEPRPAQELPLIRSRQQQAEPQPAKELPLIRSGQQQAEPPPAKELPLIRSRQQQVEPRQEQVIMFSRHCCRLGPIGVGLREAVLYEPTTIHLLLDENGDEKCVSCELDFCSQPTKCTVVQTVPHQYKITYTPMNRGVHQLHIKVDGQAYLGSPFRIVVRPSIETRGKPVKVIKGLMKPTGVALSKEGHVVVVEESNKCVTIYDPSGDDFKRRLSFGSSIKRHETGLGKPCGVAVLGENILVVDCERHSMSVFTFNGNYVRSIGQKGSRELEFNEPMGIGVHPETQEIYVADFSNCRIQVLNPDLTFSRRFGSEGNGDGEFYKPWGVAFDSTGLLYVADGGNHRIQVFSTDGTFLRKFGGRGYNRKQLSWPSSLAIDRKNQLLYVTEDDNNRISVFSLTGDYVTSFGKKGKIEGEFVLPHGIAVDEDGLNIFVADHHNDRLQIF